jgi:hypothetical protein
VPNTRTFAQLAPGAYVVSADTVEVGGTEYGPTPRSQTAGVTADATSTANVVYGP